MTAWKNEILPYLIEDPFQNYSEIYERGLFQFSANEIDLKLEISKFDQINIGDTVQLEKNDIHIAGYVKNKKRYPLEYYGVIGLQNGMILTKSNTNQVSLADNVWLTPEQILGYLSAPIFRTKYIDLGSWPNLASVYYNTKTYPISPYSSLTVKLYQYYHYPNEEPRFWKIAVQINYITGGSWQHAWLYDRKARDLTDNWDSYFGTVSKDSSLWEELNDLEYPKSEIIRKWIEQKIAPSGYFQTYLYKKVFFDIKNTCCLFVVISNFMFNYQFEITLIENYHGIAFDQLYYTVEAQPLANILSDLCFFYGSFFTVRDLDILHVKPLNEGVKNIDIADYHDFVIEYQQEIKEQKYENYHLKTIGIDGANAFGVGEDLVAALNNYYRQNYSFMLETVIKIYRVKNWLGRADFPLVNLNDNLIDGNYIFGRVVEIQYAEEGKIYILTCQRYISNSTSFNQWWSP